MRQEISSHQSIHGLQLTYNQALANIFTKYGNRFMPFVLIGLGTFIFLDSHSFSFLNLIHR
jgi:cadmium resistance protein CadD (predicted permease)